MFLKIFARNQKPLHSYYYFFFFPNCIFLRSSAQLHWTCQHCIPLCMDGLLLKGQHKAQAGFQCQQHTAPLLTPPLKKKKLLKKTHVLIKITLLIKESGAQILSSMLHLFQQVPAVRTFDPIYICYRCQWHYELYCQTSDAKH